MRIGRTLPPAAAPIGWRDLAGGIRGMFRGRRETDRFAGELEEFFGVEHCFLTSSGKAALTVILEALKELRPDRDRVLIPAFTCYSVPSAIVRAGLEVSLCDVDPATLDFDFHELESKLSDPRLLCVIPVHLFGIPADVDRVRGMLEDPEVFIVEDAAQAMGGERGGRKLGTLGDVGFFSLGRGKALSTVEGGVILTKRDDLGRILAKKAKALAQYRTLEMITLVFYAFALMLLTRPALFWLPKGLPFLRLGETIYDPTFKMRRMSGVQVGLARDWQKKLAKFQGIRRAAVQDWITRLNSFSLLLGIYHGGQLPLLRFPVLLRAACDVLEGGERQGLGIGPVYPDSVDRISDLSRYFKGQDFPGAGNVARAMVTLPVHERVTGDDKKRIFELLIKTDPIEHIRVEEKGLEP
jgi:perosamine synthetase